MTGNTIFNMEGKMAIQFVLGPAGAGKTEYLIRTLIAESMDHHDENYLYIVPEQFTMEAQRDIVTMHPRHGSMNIDAIGLNRLAYRVFDELSVSPGRVLEDFGKSMLIKKILIECQDELLVYGSYSNKMGFIDEMKSMMSELFQYAVDRDSIDAVMDRLDSDSAVYRKIHDVQLIYRHFEEYNRNDGYIVAEQLAELLTANIEHSKLIADSHMYFDGFTGFTPVQMELVRKFMVCAKSVTFAFTIDVDRISLSKPKEYELFRLTRETMMALCKAAGEEHIDIMDHVLMVQAGDIPHRFESNPELAELERSLFRYPHGRYEDTTDKVHIVATERAGEEALYVAGQIRRLVRDKGYRYRDIAVVAGDLQDVARYYKQAMEEYDIPVFIDANVALKGDPCSDSIRAFLALMTDNFSFDSMFRLLKSGMTDVDIDDVERLENYALRRNLRGYKMWNRSFAEGADAEDDYVKEMESIRGQVMEMFTDECIGVFNPTRTNSKKTVVEYSEQLYQFAMRLDMWKKLEHRKKFLYDEQSFDEGDAYGQIFDKVVALLDKMAAIIGNEKMTVKEFADILDAGLADMEIGIVPPTVDRVVVGDMTRSRLNHVKIVFFTGVNEGIIPKPAKKGRILSTGDRQKLEELGVELAPSDKTNAYTEQFYIYTILTKASDEIYIVYRRMDEDMRAAKPSYLVDRIMNIFPKLEVENHNRSGVTPETVDGVLRYITESITDEENVIKQDRAYRLVDLLTDRGYSRELEAIECGRNYVNSVKQLSPETLRMLYGRNLTATVSRLERYAECQFKYFLTYGLALRERETSDINAANVGTILHSTMERVFTFVRDLRQNDWVHLDEAELEKKASEFVDQSAMEEAGMYFDDSFRAGYMKGLLTDIAVRTARTLRTFVRCGDMKPENFERRFNTAVDKDNIESYDFALANDMTMSLTGVIDRIDEYTGDGESYFKIIDYKSSDKKLDIKQVLGGLQMQLVTYGAIAYELEKRRAARTGADESDVHVGGLLYYTFDDPVADVTGLGERVRFNEDESGFETGDDALFGGVLMDSFEKKVLEESRYSGLYNNSDRALAVMDRDSDTLKGGQSLDEQLLKKLMETNRRNIERLAGSISEGYIDINPVKEGSVNACQYCDFNGICAFDCKYSGNSYTRIYRGETEEFDTLSEKIDAVRKELETAGKDLTNADKKLKSAKKKLDDAEKKVQDKGEKATQKMRESVDAARTAFDNEQRNVEEIRKRIDVLMDQADQLGMSIPDKPDTNADN